MSDVADVPVDLPRAIADDLNRVGEQLLYLDVLLEHRDARARRRKRAGIDPPLPPVKTVFRLPDSLSPRQ